MARKPMQTTNEPSADGYVLTAKSDGGLDVRGERGRLATPIPRALDATVVEPHREELDRYLIRTRNRVGAGIQFALGAEGPLADLVCVAWYRASPPHGPTYVRRAAFCLSLRDCLDHINAYEDLADTKGEKAAAEWQRAQRVLSEAEAVRRREELRS